MENEEQKNLMNLELHAVDKVKISTKDEDGNEIELVNTKG